MAGKPKADPSRLKNNLERSIEAHRLRLQKARGLNTAKTGRLCECKNCDVTSVKPSIVCTKYGTRKLEDETVKVNVPASVKLPTNIPTASTRLLRRKQSGSGGKNDKKVGKGRLDNNVELNGPTVDVSDEEIRSAISHNAKNEEHNERDESNLLGTVVGSECDSSSKVDDGKQMPEQRTLSGSSCELPSGSPSEEAQENTKDVPDIDLNKVIRRLESIRIVDSAGDEHRINTASIETKILDIVNEIVRKKLSANENVETTLESQNLIHKTDKELIQKQEKTLPVSSVNDVKQMGSAQPTQNAGINNSETSGPDLINKYKSVIDVLLNYVSCGAPARRDMNPGTGEIGIASGDVKSVQHAADAAHVSSVSQFKMGNQGHVANNFDLPATGKRSNIWCRGIGSQGTQSVNNGYTGGLVSNSIHGNQFDLTRSMALAKEVRHVSARRMLSTPMGQMPHPSQINGGYCHPLKYTNNSHVYTPHMNCYVDSRYQGPWDIHTLTKKNSSRQVTSSSRRHHLLRRNRTDVTAVPPVGCKSDFDIHKTSANEHYMQSLAPRIRNTVKATGAAPVGILNSPFRVIQRQSTGSLYSRNTGRAYGHQVQAAMM
ncbi:uncharacterized protein BXIN_2229 [Babesia sp. Xinjiang]|uniref:uncharacterized protein n=1 Tax=Babesia sp. Xinjiang TaxID=462227 RepID=UPI000A266854|nr:uncharacterized protein BXIN_2229 [Babesia sp. Xinjiang]ORM40760.1 hypothetical protein BXIN_2229 [Babesia sp. Xinjiang]